MSGTVWLGPLALRGFEVPDGILWGGRQRLAVHRLPGGARVIDAMGRDDAAITWSGAFSGPDAAARARLADLLRAEGGAWPLAWDGFFFTVVVSAFHAEYAGVNWIPYRIACTVLRDEAAGLAEDGLALAGDVLGDLAAAEGFGALDLAGPLAAAGAASALSLGSAANGAAGLALAGAVAANGDAIAAAEAALPVAPAASAGALSAAGDAAGRLAALAGARGYVLRAQGGLGGGAERQ
jgi:hypothetical protein